MPGDNQTQSLNNQQILLLEQAKASRHQLQSCKAAFRLLEGAVLTGLVEAESANEIVPKIVKYEEKLLNKNGFAKEFFELAAKPLFKDAVNKKYKEIKERFPRIDGKKILVIDDRYTETGWKQVLNLLFGDNVIVGQNNKKSALNYLGEKSDIVLMIMLDLRLPDKEEQGIELLKQINKDYPQIPVVIFSTTDSIIYARQVFKLGAWDYFPKEPADTESHNPVDYFLSFSEIIKNIWGYHKKYIEPLWEKIISLEKDLQKFNNQQGSGLAQLTTRELKKAYKHFVFEQMNIFTPSFLEMNVYDEVIYCCSKAFESYLRLGVELLGLDKERKFLNKNNEPSIEEVEKVLRGLKEIIESFENNKTDIRLSENWFKNAYKINKLRNRYIHGYLIGSNYKSSKMKPADKEVAQQFFENTLQLIGELQNKIEQIETL